VSQEVAKNEQVREGVKEGLFTLDIPGKGLPKFLHSPKGLAGVLMGVPSRSLPSSFSTPYGEVKLVTVKALLPEELAYLDEQGDPGVDELARRFVENGEEHLSLSRRKPVT
jgi:hypothetical protein